MRTNPMHRILLRRRLRRARRRVVDLVVQSRGLEDELSTLRVLEKDQVPHRRLDERRKMQDRSYEVQGELARAKAEVSSLETVLGARRDPPTAEVVNLPARVPSLHVGVIILALAWAISTFGFAWEARNSRRDQRVLELLTVRASVGDIHAQGVAIEAQARAAAAEEQAVAAIEDADVCHQRVSDVQFSLEALARSIPGRARAPYIPIRKRPPGAPGSEPRQGTAVGQPGAPAEPSP